MASVGIDVKGRLAAPLLPHIFALARLPGKQCIVHP